MLVSYWLLYVAIGLTMYQLAINLQQVIGEINEKQHKFRFRLLFAIKFLFVLVSAFFLVKNRYLSFSKIEVLVDLQSDDLIYIIAVFLIL